MQTTVGAEKYIKKLNIGQPSALSLHIWDTTGQEKFRSLSPQYYRDADAFVIVYSISKQASFDAISDYWLQSIFNYGPADVEIALVGTWEKDPAMRCISEQEICQLKENYPIKIHKELCPEDKGQVESLFQEITLSLETKKSNVISFSHFSRIQHSASTLSALVGPCSKI